MGLDGALDWWQGLWFWLLELWLVVVVLECPDVDMWFLLEDQCNDFLATGVQHEVCGLLVVEWAQSDLG